MKGLPPPPSPDHSAFLLISYLFPPAGGVSVQRALSFAKYLPDHGFRVHVLAARNPSTPTIDAGLLRHIPPAVTVHRTFTPEVPYRWKQRVWRWISPARGGASNAARTPTPAPAASDTWKTALGRQVRKLFCPDPEVVWVPFALRRARRLVSQYGIRTVLTTAPPFSAFLIGTDLKKYFPHLTLIADFRDEWLEFYLSTFQFHRDDYIVRRSTAMERATVELSDLVLSVTPSIVQQLRDRYPDQPARKFVNLPNGYDPDTFRDFRPRPHPGDQIVVTYVGTVYTASSPRFYLDGLDRLPDALRARFETRFVGRIVPEEMPHLAGRKSVIRQLGFMSQADAFRQMEETDYLLLVMTDAGSLTGKIFEYLATGKPILAFAPRGGEVERILHETGAGWCADPADPSAIHHLLVQAAEAAGSARPIQPNPEAIRRYERPQLTAELARLIQDLRTSSSGSLLP